MEYTIIIMFLMMEYTSVLLLPIGVLLLTTLVVDSLPHVSTIGTTLATSVGVLVFILGAEVHTTPAVCMSRYRPTKLAGMFHRYVEYRGCTTTP